MLDKSSIMRDNVPNNDEYERVVDNILSRPQVFKMDEHEAINDTSHEHQLVEDPTDTIGDAVMHMCSVPNCGIGFYIQK